MVKTAHPVCSYGPPVSTKDTTEEPSGAPAAEPTDIPRYEVRVRGRLAPRWAAWFDGMSLSSEEEGITVIRAPVIDQAALHGLLQKLRDVGIPLVSLTELPSDTSTTTQGPAPHHEGNRP